MFEVIGRKPDQIDSRCRYDAVVHTRDIAIGRVLASLDGTATGKNTFVFFMSDNGAFRLNRKELDVGINTPPRSGGFTCWEGGIRIVKEPDDVCCYRR